MCLSTRERLLAALAHLAALTFGNGLVAPAALWSESRKKSAYVRYQTLQAYGYQSLGYTLWLLSVLLLMTLVHLVLLIVAGLAPELAWNKAFLISIGVLFIVMIFGATALYLLPALIGAALCGLGKDFRYPILGSRLARSLSYDPSQPEATLDTDFEERFAAALGHFAVIIPVTGLLAPAWLWISHKEHSPWLKFQSAQTVLYQLFVNVLPCGLFLASLSASLATMLLAALWAQSAEWTILAGMMTTIILFSCAGLLLPLFHILGQWGGLQTLRGRDFHYPLLGRWLAKRA